MFSTFFFFFLRMTWTLTIPVQFPVTPIPVLAGLLLRVVRKCEKQWRKNKRCPLICWCVFVLWSCLEVRVHITASFQSNHILKQKTFSTLTFLACGSPPAQTTAFSYFCVSGTQRSESNTKVKRETWRNTAWWALKVPQRVDQWRLRSACRSRCARYHLPVRGDRKVWEWEWRDCVLN